jgi:hypothetical protein
MNCQSRALMYTRPLAICAALLAGPIVAARAELIEPPLPIEQPDDQPIKVIRPLPLPRPSSQRTAGHHFLPVRSAMTTMSTPKLQPTCGLFACGQYIIVGIGF